MFIRIKKSSSRKSVVQLVEDSRDTKTGKVKQRVIRHIGSAETEEDLNRLKQLGEHLKAEEIETRKSEELQPCLFAQDISSQKIETANKTAEKEKESYAVDDMRKLRTQDLVITGIHEVYGKQFDRLGFDSILPHPSRKVHSQKILRDIVLARIANPDSKRGSVRFLKERCGVNLNLDSVYKAMDYLDDKAIENIQKQSLNAANSLFPEKLDVLFYDATTLYFESFTEDELRSKGYSKDHKFNEVQILLSIFVTHQGIPVGYDLFPGSTYEGHTLIKALDNLKQRFQVDKVVFVADSGMLQKENLQMLEEHGYQYIVGARLKNMSTLISKQILSEEGYSALYDGEDECVKGKIIELDSHKKLIVTHSSKRARKDANERDKALQKLEKKLKKSGSVKSVLSNNGYSKFMKLKGESQIEIDDAKVQQASHWDGLHGVTTNIENVDINEIMAHYRGLWQVEETFRVTKHDLRIRPIYHWTEKRIKAHIAMCYMALVCVRHAEHRMTLANKKMSPERIRKALLNVGVTRMKHLEDKRIFAVPFNPDDDAKIIYKTNGIPFSTTPYLTA